MRISEEAKRFLSVISDDHRLRPCYRISEVAGYEPIIAELLSAGLVSRTRLGRYPAIEVTDSGLAAQARV